MIKSWRMRVAGLALMLGMLTACAAQPPVPQDRYYRLQAAVATAPMGTPALPGTLEVERFSADGLTAGRPIVYMQSDNPNQLLEYHYHFWTQPPTVMLRDELVTYLRGSNVANNVVTPEMRLPSDYVLTGRIRRLEQIVGSPNATAMELEISLRRQADGKLLFLKSYRHETATSSAGVGAAVDALNQSLNVVYADILADLKSR